MSLRPLAVAAAFIFAVPVTAQEHRSTVGEAGHIATQPGRDVGIGKTKVPPVLASAANAPYGASGTGSCAQIKASASALDDAIGPEYGRSMTPWGSKKGALAKASGEAVVNTIIPFRGVVREVSGAASADRRFAAAVQAGFARRGYLHGLYTARHCPGAL